MSATESATAQELADLDPREFDSEEFQRDPYPIYKRLRDFHPIYHDRFHNRWIISRYWDVDAAFQDSKSFDRAVYKPDGPYDFGSRHIFGPNILECGNSGEHQRLRNIILATGWVRLKTPSRSTAMTCRQSSNFILSSN